MKAPRCFARTCCPPESYTWRWFIPGGLPIEGENETPAFHVDHCFNGFGMKNGVIPVAGFVCDVVLYIANRREHGTGPILTAFDMQWLFQRSTDNNWWGLLRRDYLNVVYSERLIVQGYRLPAFDRFKIYFYWGTAYGTANTDFMFWLTIRTA